MYSLAKIADSKFKKLGSTNQWSSTFSRRGRLESLPMWLTDSKNRNVLSQFWTLNFHAQMSSGQVLFQSCENSFWGWGLLLSLVSLACRNSTLVFTFIFSWDSPCVLVSKLPLLIRILFIQWDPLVPGPLFTLFTMYIFPNKITYCWPRS